MAESELGALNLGGIRDIFNFVGGADREDTYRFSVGGTSSTAPINLNASLTGMSADADLRLYRDVNNNGIIDAADGAAVAVSARSSNADDSFNIRLTTPGNYIAQVVPFNNNSTSYRLRLSNTGSLPSNLLPTEVNGGTLSASASTFNGVVQDLSGTINDDTADVYRFTMGSTGNFNASLTGISSGADVDMRLIRDGNNNGIVDAGEEVARSAIGGNADDSINVHNLAQGNYLLQTYLFRGTSGGYTLRTSNTGTAPSNLLAIDVNAGTLGTAPFSSNSAVSTNDAADVYRFTMGSTGNFNASLTGISSGADVDMRLIRDGNNNGIVDAGEEVVRSAAGSNADDSINVRNLAQGNYLLQTYLYSGTNGNYTLRMSNTGAQGSNPSNLLPIETNVGVLSGSTSRSGSVGVNDAADTFRFSLASNRTVNLSLNGLSTDADLRLIRDGNNNGIVDAGEELRRSAAAGTSSENISQFLSAGNYIAQVYLYAGAGNTSYALNLSS